MDAVVTGETVKEATKNGDSGCCAVADGTADQQETHATVPDMVERQWLRTLCLLHLFTTISHSRGVLILLFVVLVGLLLGWFPGRCRPLGRRFGLNLRLWLALRLGFHSGGSGLFLLALRL